jgi:hypothetical protein
VSRIHGHITNIDRLLIGATTLSIITISITTFSRMTLSIMTLSISTYRTMAVFSFIVRVIYAECRILDNDIDSNCRYLI